MISDLGAIKETDYSHIKKVPMDINNRVVNTGGLSRCWRRECKGKGGWETSVLSTIIYIYYCIYIIYIYIIYIIIYI